MEFDSQYFTKFNFTKLQIIKNLSNALKDFNIAKKDGILDVKFNYAYSAFIKCGIALLSFYGLRVKSVPGHHAKIIEKTAGILKDSDIAEMGNIMRSKRNLDFYSGGIEVTEKECREYIEFVADVIARIKKIVKT
jgi:hypothetical protein